MKRLSVNVFNAGVAVGCAAMVAAAYASGRKLEGAVALIVADWLLREALRR